MHQMRVTRGQNLFKEGDDYDSVYLIREGDFETSKLLKYVVGVDY